MDIIRRVRFSPYRKGFGPRFALTIWDTHKKDKYDGKAILGYRLRQGRKTIFQGENYSPSPCWAIDGNESLKGLMSFLTLKPGDTDREYFDKYTKEQLEFAANHAEALESEVYDRFGEI